MEASAQLHALTALRLVKKKPPVTTEMEVWCAHNRSERFREN
jgi:hypothetical protein